MEYEIDLKDLSDAYLNDDAIKELDHVYSPAGLQGQTLQRGS